jgi:hypothetical protein
MPAGCAYMVCTGSEAARARSGRVPGLRHSARGPAAHAAGKPTVASGGDGGAPPGGWARCHGMMADQAVWHRTYDHHDVTTAAARGWLITTCEGGGAQAVCAHRTQVAAVRDRLPPACAPLLVETANRFQGLERPVMLVYHQHGWRRARRGVQGTGDAGLAGTNRRHR